MRAVKATPGDWVDTNERVSVGVARLLRARGVVGVFRYAPLPGVPAGWDVTADELNWLTGEGLQVCLVQHPRYPNWQPKIHSGAADARAAAGYASAIGYPVGCHIFCDWEGPAPSTSVDDSFGFLLPWGNAITLAGYLAGLYVGYGHVLDAAQLYGLHPYNSYWSDIAHRQIAVRGCSIVQGNPFVVGGVNFDSDTVRPDLLGDLPMVAAG